MRGHVVKRAKDSWSVVLSLGRDPATGKRRQKWLTVRGRKSDAEAELARILAEYGKGSPVATGRMTVSEYLDIWLRDVVPNRNRPRTVREYASLVRHHIAPNVGNIRLTRLEPGDVERMLAEMRRKGLSSSTAHHAYAVFGKALKDAQRKGAVARNACRLVEPPRIEPYRVDAPSVETVNQVLAAADAELRLLLKFVARTGVRRGEVLALKWNNVDVERRVAIVTQSAQRIPRQGVLLQPTKSASGYRGIALDAELATDLQQHRAGQAVQILRMGSAYRDQGLVFADPVGQIIGPDRLSHAFKRVAKFTGLPKLRLHDLRHGHASALIAAGVHPKVVQERLGHASAAFTMQTYGHVAAGLQERAADAYAAMAASQSG